MKNHFTEIYTYTLTKSYPIFITIIETSVKIL